MPVPSTAPSAAPPPPRAHFNPKSIRALQTFHRLTRPSPLSAEASDQNYRGLINLAGILLVVLNARLAVENMLKYGLRLQLPSDPLSQWPTTWPGLTCALCLPAFGVAAHLVEVAAWRRWIGTRAAALLHVAVIVAAFWLPISVIRVSGANIGSGFILMTLTLVLFMKLVSFAHVSDDARKTRDDKSKLAALDEQVAVAASASAASSASAIAVLSAVSAVSAAGGNATKASISPASAGIVASVADATAAAAAAATPPCYCDAACLGRYRPTLAHTFYFLAAPTLCFQLEYPRSPAVRWRFVLRRLVELLFCLALMVFFSEQYIAPAVQNTLVYMDTMKFVHLFERILKLAVPSLFVWLLMFYALFHAALNLLAELLRFGDRLFYKAWWNASTLEEYWKLWNVPGAMRDCVHVSWTHIFPLAISNSLANLLFRVLLFAIDNSSVPSPLVVCQTLVRAAVARGRDADHGHVLRVFLFGSHARGADLGAVPRFLLVWFCGHVWADSHHSAAKGCASILAAGHQRLGGQRFVLAHVLHFRAADRHAALHAPIRQGVDRCLCVTRRANFI